MADALSVSHVDMFRAAGELQLAEVHEDFADVNFNVIDLSDLTGDIFYNGQLLGWPDKRKIAAMLKLLFGE
jgi:hypothetical protein